MIYRQLSKKIAVKVTDFLLFFSSTQSVAISFASNDKKNRKKKIEEVIIEM